MVFPGTPLNLDDVISTCPVCGGKMEIVYDRHHQTVCVCADCHSGISVPWTAWQVAKAKRDAKWPTKR
jgi:hypothetical protein